MAFLLARLDEDEGVAQAAGADQWRVWCAAEIEGDDNPYLDEAERRAHLAGEPGGYVKRHDEECQIEGPCMTLYDEGGHERAHALHIVRHDPARTLAEVEAKRRIVAMGQDFDVYSEPYTAQQTWERTTRLLALPYADHPHYRPEWAPTD